MNQTDTQKEYGTALTEADYEQALTFIQLAEDDLRRRMYGSAHCTLLAAMDRLQVKPINPAPLPNHTTTATNQTKGA